MKRSARGGSFQLTELPRARTLPGRLAFDSISDAANALIFEFFSYPINGVFECVFLCFM